MLGRLVNDALAKTPPDYPWGNTLPLFKDSDLGVCNLECVLADSGMPWTRTPKVFHFRSDAKNVAVLKAAQLDYVSLANNHVLDYGYEALYEMMAILEREDIAYAGVGRDVDTATRPTFLFHDNLRIGCIAFTDNEPVWEAAANKGGIFYTPVDLADGRARKLLNLVQQIKTQADLVIVSAHWGPNWGCRPQRHHVPFAHALIDHGADIILGHSCHVFQGIEIYKGRPILYSCGDFVDDYRVDPDERNDQSFLFKFTITGGKVTQLVLHPTVIRSFQARLAETGEAEMIAHKMQTLCAEMRTSSTWDPTTRLLQIPVTATQP